jgi:hypothetical protein
MDPLIVLGVLAGAPLALALVLRVSAVYMFASVAAGGLLVEYLSDDVVLAADTFLKNKDPQLVVHLTLLFLPVALTLFFLRKTLKSSRFLLEFVPLVASVAMLVVLAMPQLPKNLHNDILTTPYGKLVDQSEHVVIGAAALLNLGLMWLFGRKGPEGHSGHKKH